MGAQLVAFFANAILSCVLTWGVISFAARWNLLDNENNRSLHTGEIPRGGGLAVVASLSVTLLIWILVTGPPNSKFVVWGALAMCSAVLGLVDDFRDLSVASRLICQALISAIFCGTVLSLPENAFFALSLFAWLFVLWGINGANFLDGADGMLASQSILVATSLLFIDTPDRYVAMVLVSLSGACVGFLCWNWQPAKIFLGDTGSYFLGFVLVSSCLLKWSNGHPLVPMIILLIPLFADVTLTLLRRIILRRKFWRPHREHLYQLCILNGFSHTQITAIYALLMITIFIPLSGFSLRHADCAAETFLFGCCFAAMLWGLSYKILAGKNDTI